MRRALEMSGLCLAWMVLVWAVLYWLRFPAAGETVSVPATIEMELPGAVQVAPSPFDHGGVPGDGVDDAPAIEACLAASGWCDLLGRTWDLATSVAPPAGSRLRGGELRVVDGCAAVAAVDPATGWWCAVQTQPWGTGRDGVVVEDVVVHLNGAAQAPGVCLKAFLLEGRGEIRRCGATGFRAGLGVEAFVFSALRVADCWATGAAPGVVVPVGSWQPEITVFWGGDYDGATIERCRAWDLRHGEGQPSPVHGAAISGIASLVADCLFQNVDIGVWIQMPESGRVTVRGVRCLGVGTGVAVHHSGADGILDLRVEGAVVEATEAAVSVFTGEVTGGATRGLHRLTVERCDLRSLERSALLLNMFRKGDWGQVRVLDNVMEAGPGWREVTMGYLWSGPPPVERVELDGNRRPTGERERRWAWSYTDKRRYPWPPGLGD